MATMYSVFNPQLSISIPYISTQKLCYLHKAGTAKYLEATKNYISLSFSENDVGIVDYVELDVLETFPDYMIFKAVIHFKKWFLSASNYVIQQRIFEGNADFMYRHNCFWILEKVKDSNTT